ncbi:2-hydroxyacid dehydrogenase [Gangjinia marincola]|uniref:2-hydroxyacid dehydrogenase n=1 Tax=Gangjinia marincola TaxID=578463 RepID=A0ABN1MI85_9FLAO
MKILHLDKNHPLLIDQLDQAGFQNDEDYTSTKAEIEDKIMQYDGIVIRSRFPVDRSFLEKATSLKFIGRVGAGLENIDTAFAEERNIQLFNAPEGNRNAVGEHALGMLLSLLNKLNSANHKVREGIWDREGNRGIELEGKTIGIIGYGNMGNAFAKKLQGFDVDVLCYDIQKDVGNEFARQVNLVELQQKADVISLHTPLTNLTIGLINNEFIAKMKKKFWLINTARGKSVVTKDLVNALKSRKILGAGLDVLEYETSSFENFFKEGEAIYLPEAFNYLLKAENVILSPHVAGWTVESKVKLAQTIVNKIVKSFPKA